MDIKTAKETIERLYTAKWIDDKSLIAIQLAISVLDLLEKAEMPKKKDLTNAPWQKENYREDVGYNQALEDCRPYVAKLERELKDLRGEE